MWLAAVAVILLALVLLRAWLLRGHSDQTLRTLVLGRFTWGAVVCWMIITGVLVALIGRPPLLLGSGSEAGVGVTEIRHDGWTRTGTIESWVVIQTSPRYIVRVGSGEPFAIAVRVKNTGWLPIRVLGWTATDRPPARNDRLDYILVGLALPAVDGSASAPLSNLPEFRPFDVAPGSQATFIMVLVGGRCADPAADLLPRDPDLQVLYVNQLVVDTLGWQRNATFWPSFEITVPTRPDCRIGTSAGPWVAPGLARRGRQRGRPV